MSHLSTECPLSVLQQISFSVPALQFCVTGFHHGSVWQEQGCWSQGAGRQRTNYFWLHYHIIWLQVNEWCKKLRKEERGLERQVAHGNYDIMWESANEHKANNMPGDCDQKGRSQGHSLFEGGGKERGQGCVQDPGKVWQRIRWLFEPQKVE